MGSILINLTSRFVYQLLVREINVKGGISGAQQSNAADSGKCDYMFVVRGAKMTFLYSSDLIIYVPSRNLFSPAGTIKLG